MAKFYAVIGLRTTDKLSAWAMAKNMTQAGANTEVDCVYTERPINIADMCAEIEREFGSNAQLMQIINKYNH